MVAASIGWQLARLLPWLERLPAGLRHDGQADGRNTTAETAKVATQNLPWVSAVENQKVTSNGFNYRHRCRRYQ